ncbi:hypothetical protein I7I53_04388 [Histoplasma capsulatum var. duboisii H88]|uniref:Uncharacterized protein n=1 Tax=Ajellomyces capsulatus (strain H88) TaxID=544711 RepID=A0A8A1LVS4_AJEC8|nr:hypothetical protein I7I53_04388 [Histoplasma capsulatum var. duboisii H88]
MLYIPVPAGWSGYNKFQWKNCPLIFPIVFSSPSVVPVLYSLLVSPSQQTTQSRLADQIAPDLVAATTRKVYKPVEIRKLSHLSSHPHNHTHPTSLKF